MQCRFILFIKFNIALLPNGFRTTFSLAKVREFVAGQGNTAGKNKS